MLSANGPVTLWAPVVLSVGPRRFGESRFEFLERNSSHAVRRIRDELDRWYGQYPNEHQQQLRARFRLEFHAAFFELLLHRVLTQLGCSVEVEPSVPWSESRPDFRAVKDDKIFYVEARVAKDKSDKQRARDSVEESIVALINDLHTPDYFLHLRHLAINEGTQPSSKGVLEFIKTTIEKADFTADDEILKEKGLDALPVHRYLDAGISIATQLQPKSPKTRGKAGLRAIGVFPVETHMGGADRAIRSSLRAKARQHGRPSAPYLIAVNSITDWGTDREDVEAAFFGSEEILVTRSHRELRLSRGGDGFFFGPRGPKHTRVSAALITSAWPWALTSEAAFVRHPAPEHNLPMDVLPFTSLTMTGPTPMWSPGNSLADVLGLPNDWPGA